MELIIIGLLGGLITGISPCILPVLPVIFLTGGAQSARFEGDSTIVPARRSRPYLVIAGLVVSFTLVTLVGSLLLGLLNLPQDIIRWVGIAVLVIIGVGLLIPRFEQLLEKPFQWLPRREVQNRGQRLRGRSRARRRLRPVRRTGARGDHRRRRDGPHRRRHRAADGILRDRRRASAARLRPRRPRRHRAHPRVPHAASAACGSRRASRCSRSPSASSSTCRRRCSGSCPDYTAQLQRDLTDNEQAAEALDLGGLVTDENRELDNCTNGADRARVVRHRAVDPRASSSGSTPRTVRRIDLAELRGQVVLIDFWAYSCINCQRSIPHVVAWDEAYRDAGLQVIGIHSPEYAFEKDAAQRHRGRRATSASPTRSRSTTPSRPGPTTATATGPRTT